MEETKQSLTSLDLRFLVRELKAGLIGGIIRKVYQYGKAGSKQLLLEIFIPGKGAKLLYWDSNKAFLTEKKTPVPVEPPNFCMFLRKHLLGRKILDIRQYKFDRVLEIISRDHILILENIPPGNAILCDSSFNIIMPLEIQKWRGRIVRPKTPYKHPRTGDNPLEMDLNSFHRLLNASDKELGAVLAVNLGFGPLYSSELCRRAGLDSRALSSQVPLQAALKLHNLINSVLNMDANPVVYQDMVSPFPLETRKESKPVKQGGSFSQALDELFSAQALEIKKEEKEQEIQEKEKKLERIIDTQKEARDKWDRISGESQGTAELIRKNSLLLESVLNGINQARESGLSWEEIKGKVMGEQTPEAQAIKEIREGDALVVVELDGKPIELDFRLGVEGNAARYFEDMKWAKKKLTGAGEALEERKQELETRQEAQETGPAAAPAAQELKEGIEPHQPAQPQPPQEENVTEKPEPLPVETSAGPTEAPKAPEIASRRREILNATSRDVRSSLVLTHKTSLRPMQRETQKPKRKRRKWFEKFHWFLSSDGFLVIGGKDAKQNEMIISKYMNPGDLVFHADIPGASFVVIQSKGKELTVEARKEAAELAAASSRAWSRGLGNMDVFCARPEQVSKTPPSGEYLPRGSFMITGERAWFRDMELKLSIGIAIDRENREAGVISGPVMPVRTHSDYFVTIRPGYKKSLELARDIKNNILIKASPEDKFILDQVPLEDIQRLIPSGSGDIVEYGV